MTREPDSRTPAERVNDLPKILFEMRQAVREALALHRQMGNPVVVWRDGRVQWIEAKDIPVELTVPLPEME